MLAAERYEKIVRLVNERGSMRVSELSELCQVTEETIRRDLDRLESAGRLLRSHGGAVSVQGHQPETPYFEREVMQAEEKKRIAREAVKRIQPRERILLDASTTAWYMAADLPDMPLTVLTNSLKVAAELGNKEQIEVISTGGQLARRSMSWVGPLAERSLDAYHVDKLFLSCKGFHLERGISESNELQAMVKRKMIDIADEVVLLADASKFGQQSFAHVAPTERLHTIITDYRPDEAVLGELGKRSIELVSV
ncbi:MULTISPECIES: DeoR/GlpR family DNA-binding transcription regulator [Paenibacillus]|nr:DeoR family transcriptional regulator [Paenibacillus macerans]